MSGKFFWLVVCTIFMLVGHLSYVLFFPPYMMEQKLSTSFVSNISPSFVILDREQTLELFPAEDPNVLHGICPFDVSQGTVKISIAPYMHYWSLSIYSQRGDSYYSINDRQSLGSNLKIFVREASNDEADPNKKQQELVADKTVIDAPALKGWAVLRFQIYNKAARAAIAEEMKTFTCERGEP